MTRATDDAGRAGTRAAAVAGRPAAVRRRWWSARGQTTTEYLMISGFITLVGLFVMRVMQLPFQRLLAQMTSYVLNNAADLPW